MSIRVHSWFKVLGNNFIIRKGFWGCDSFFLLLVFCKNDEGEPPMDTNKYELFVDGENTGWGEMHNGK